MMEQVARNNSRIQQRKTWDKPAQEVSPRPAARQDNSIRVARVSGAQGSTIVEPRRPSNLFEALESSSEQEADSYVEPPLSSKPQTPVSKVPTPVKKIPQMVS